MIFYIFLILFVSLIIYLLFVPIVLHVDTSSNQYYLKIGGLAKANFLYDEAEIVKINLRVIGFNYDVFPLRKSSKPKPKKTLKKTSDKMSMKTIPFQKVWRVIKSFKVNQFLLDIDTGDCIANSKLYPGFACCNYYFNSQLLINYQGRNRLVLSIQNRPIRLIKAYMNI